MMDIINSMGTEDFFRLCNRLVSEMGFKIKNSVYRGDVVVFDAYMPLPGKNLHYVIIFLKKPKVTKEEVLDMIDVETVEVRWMIITTGEFEGIEDLRGQDELSFMDGKDFERLLEEFGLKEELMRPERGKEAREGRYLPSAGELESMLQWAKEFLESGNYDKALEYVDKALGIKVTPEGKKIKARILKELGRSEEAISLLTSVLEEDVKDDEAWLILGEVLEDIDDFEEAEQAYSQCLHFNSRNVSCWINRGNVMLALEKYQEALMCYERALEINQNLPSIWNNRGIALKYMGKYDEALKSYNTALRLDKNFAEVYLNKAYLYFDLRKYEEARNALAEYLKIKEDSRGLILLARIYLKRNLKKDALEILERVLELEPGNQEARELIDKIKGKTKEIKEYEKLKELLEDELLKLEEIYKKEGERGDLEKIENLKNLLKKGELSQVLSDLLRIKDGIFENKIKSLEDVLYENTKKLLQISNLEVPEDLRDLSYKELKVLGDEVLKREAVKKEAYEFKNLEINNEAYAHLLYENVEWDKLKKMNNEYAYNALGLRYLNSKKYSLALEKFQRAWEMNSEFKEAELNLAYTLYKKGEIRKAKALLKHLGYEEYLEMWNERNPRS